MHTNVVDFRVMQKLCRREWNWQSVNHIPGIHDNGPCDHGVWRLTLTAYSTILNQASTMLNNVFKECFRSCNLHQGLLEPLLLTLRNAILISGDSMHVISLRMRSMMADTSRCERSSSMQFSLPLMYSTTTSGLLVRSEPTVLLKKLANRGLSGAGLSRNCQSCRNADWIQQ